MADTPRPMNISDACTEIFRLEGMVRELRAEVERLKGHINWLEENATSIRETGAGLIEVRFIKANGFPGVQQSKSLSQCIDAARSAASGATPNTTEGGG